MGMFKRGYIGNRVLGMELPGRGKRGKLRRDMEAVGVKGGRG